MRAAAIDVGTNSVKMIIGERGEDGELRILADCMRCARLGEGVDASGKLNPEAEGRTVAVMREFWELVGCHRVDKIRLVGTSALREASNRAEFLSRVCREIGMGLEILTEKDEARFSYAAVALDRSLMGHQGQLCVVDIGGGSTEIIFGDRERMRLSKSLRLGAVRLTEQILRSDPPDRGEMEKARRQARAAICLATEGHRATRVAGVGGTVVSLARIWKNVPSARMEEVHGRTMTSADCCQLLDRLSSLRLAERKKTLVGLDPDRADIILAGAIILKEILSALGGEQLLVSTHGLRYGVLHELLKPAP